MTESLGRILLADDNETFLRSTSELLRAEGFECDAVRDAIEATRRLKEETYDVVVADIRMPGNAELEFIKSLPEIADGIQVILVTGYPTVESAVESHQSPVAAYLVKPFEFDALKSAIVTAIEKARIYRGIATANHRLDEWRAEMKQIEASLKQARTAALPSTVSAFFQLTFGNIVGALSDLHRLTDSLTRQQVQPEACAVFNCPRGSALTDAVKETIEVLEKTKGSFKSKELGELRKKLEALMSVTR
jgi:DNA-binding response OmpR family regulator